MKKIILIIGLILISISIITYAAIIEQTSEYIRISAGTNMIITGGGTCKTLNYTNNTNNLFIPKKTHGEFLSFLSNNPGNTSLDSGLGMCSATEYECLSGTYQSVLPSVCCINGVMYEERNCVGSCGTANCLIWLGDPCSGTTCNSENML